MSQLGMSFDQDQRNFRETEKRRRAMLHEARQAQLRGMPVPQEFFTAVNEGAVYDPGVQEAQRTISAYNRASQGIPELSAQFPAARRSAEEMARQRMQRSSVSDGSAYSLPPMNDEQIAATQERLRQGEARFPIGTPGLIPQGDQLAAVTEEARRVRDRAMGVQGAAQLGAERQLRGEVPEERIEDIRGRAMVASEAQKRRAIESQARSGMLGDVATAIGGVAEAGIMGRSNVAASREAAGASRFGSEQERLAREREAQATEAVARQELEAASADREALEAQQTRVLNQEDRARVGASTAATGPLLERLTGRTLGERFPFFVGNITDVTITENQVASEAAQVLGDVNSIFDPELRERAAMQVIGQLQATLDSIEQNPNFRNREKAARRRIINSLITQVQSTIQ